jgi:small subunit ribosomal protein S20
MPIKHAALKQIRKDRKRHARNHAIQSELRTLTRRLVQLLQGQKVEEARALIHVVAQKYDRAASARVIHSNTAARSKSRLMRRLNRAAGRKTA